MFFAPGVKRLLRTHPSIAERIREIDPQFNAKQLPTLAANALKSVPAFSAAEMVKANPADLVKDPTKLATLAAVASVMAESQPAPAAPVPEPLKPGAVAAKVGQLETLHIAQARGLRLALPETLREFVESTGRARALVLALLMSRDDAVRERQFDLLGKSISEEELAVVRATLPAAASLEPMLRLPALLQIFPALRQLARARSSEARQTRRQSHPRGRARRRVRVLPRASARHPSAGRARSARAAREHDARSGGGRDIQVLFATLARLWCERRARGSHGLRSGHAGGATRCAGRPYLGDGRLAAAPCRCAVAGSRSCSPSPRRPSSKAWRRRSRTTTC